MSVRFYESLAGAAETLARGRPALLYHKIGPPKPGVLHRGLYVAPRIFRAQLLELRRGGFASTPASAALDFGSPGRIALTFDDGFRSVLEHGACLLQECGFSAINFLVSSLLGKNNRWDMPAGERSEPLMDEQEVRAWMAAGHEIGAHTCTHPHLTRLSREEAREEISGSKKALEDRFGRSVGDFAYPYGDVNQAVRDLVEEAGFQRAWTTQPDVLRPGLDPFLLPRFTVVVSLRNPMNLLKSLPWPFPRKARSPERSLGKA